MEISNRRLFNTMKKLGIKTFTRNEMLQNTQHFKTVRARAIKEIKSQTKKSRSGNLWGETDLIVVLSAYIAAFHENGLVLTLILQMILNLYCIKNFEIEMWTVY
jgi:hypothetical protein